MRNYYTLAVRSDGRWSAQFGDYDRSTVAAEQVDVVHNTGTPVKHRDTCVIRTGDTQAEIDAGIAALNAKEA